MVREVRAMGMEVCTTLGMLSAEQARQLKEALVSLFLCGFHGLITDLTYSGLTAYNHNLDTSREFYPSVRIKITINILSNKCCPGYYDPVVR